MMKIHKGFSTVLALVVFGLLIIGFLVFRAVWPGVTETTPSKTVVGIQTTKCCGCPTSVPKSQIGKDGWVLYEKGKDYTKELPSTCQQVACQPCLNL